METYVFLKRAREKGTLAELVSDGANPAVQDEGIGSVGGRVLAQYAVSGAYDFVLIAELPDAAAGAKVSIQCNGRGVDTQALRAYSSEEAAAALDKKPGKPAVEAAPSGDQAIYIVLKRARERGALTELLSDAVTPEVQEQGIGELGGRVLAQHAVSGAYDFVLIAELPDSGAAAKVSIRCNARGVQPQTLRTYTPKEAAAAL